MTIHRFAVDTGQVSPDQFDTILSSNRSDVEQRHTPVALHDPSSADVKFARLQAKEMINVPDDAIQVDVFTTDADGNMQKSHFYTKAEAPEEPPEDAPRYAPYVIEHMNNTSGQ